MQRLVKTVPFLILSLTLLPGCEGRAPWADPDEEVETPARTDFGPTAAYDRRLLFLGPGTQIPTAAVFDFEALSDRDGVRRGARVRVADGREWIALVDAGWELSPMREPWRLVPHGPLKMTVNDAGELAGLEVRDELPVRLEPGHILAEHAPDAGTQLVLRQATLVLDGERRPGLLLDAQLGRSVGPGFLPRTRPATGAPDGQGGDETAAAQDSLATPINPTARPGTEALLMDTTGYSVVVAGSGAGPIAWIHHGGDDQVRRGIRLDATATEAFAEAAADVPTAWRLLSETGELLGELRMEAADRSALTAPAGVTALGYVLVSGWIEDRRVRREVFGLVRDIR